MPTRDWGKQQTGVPLSYQQGFRTSNTTSQADITLNPPDSKCGQVVTGIFATIACTGTGTTLTLMFDGVTQYVWTAAGGVLNISLAGPAIFATTPNTTVLFRLNADATRTASNVVITTAIVRL